MTALGRVVGVVRLGGQDGYGDQPSTAPPVLRGRGPGLGPPLGLIITVAHWTQPLTHCQTQAPPGRKGLQIGDEWDGKTQTQGCLGNTRPGTPAPGGAGGGIRLRRLRGTPAPPAACAAHVTDPLREATRTTRPRTPPPDPGTAGRPRRPHGTGWAARREPS